jgi:15-cis-phytoene synthase
MDAALAEAVKPSNFRYSFSLLPRKKREAIQRVYEFCRFTDDLVDNEGSDKALALLHWRGQIEDLYEGNANHPILNRLQSVVTDFNIRKELLLDVVRGVEMDLERTRYETFEELQCYCYHVASAVGLISMEIFGYSNQKTRNYAINLGYALQLTNIIRDVADDAKLGRIYIPQEDLRRFGYSEDELLNGKYDSRFVALMKFEVERAKQYYDKASALLTGKDRTTMFPAEIIRAIYFKLLTRIEQDNYRVFEHRYRVSLPYKLGAAIKYWTRSKFA